MENHRVMLISYTRTVQVLHLQDLQSHLYSKGTLWHCLVFQPCLCSATTIPSEIFQASTSLQSSHNQFYKARVEQVCLSGELTQRRQTGAWQNASIYKSRPVLYQHNAKAEGSALADPRWAARKDKVCKSTWPQGHYSRTAWDNKTRGFHCPEVHQHQNSTIHHTRKFRARPIPRITFQSSKKRSKDDCNVS